jgi:ribosome biogenesis GTPase A
MDCLIANCKEKGLTGSQIKHVELVSAKTGYNIEKLISRFFNLWNDEGDVYLLGMANAGKSVLFNQLLSSDFCRSLASTAIERATTSFWPGTTMNTVNFPITFLTPNKKKTRHARLMSDLNLLDSLEVERKRLYEKNLNLKHAECLGIVGTSFNKTTVIGQEIDAGMDATYSLDTETGRIREGENFDQTNSIEAKRLKEARAMYSPKYYADSATWFHDTPGVLGSQEMLTQFSKQELQLVFPLNVMIPRVYWMQPGQSMLVGGLMRIDLLEVCFVKTCFDRGHTY